MGKAPTAVGESIANCASNIGRQKQDDEVHRMQACPLAGESDISDDKRSEALDWRLDHAKRDAAPQHAAVVGLRTEPEYACKTANAGNQDDRSSAEVVGCRDPEQIRPARVEDRPGQELRDGWHRKS